MHMRIVYRVLTEGHVTVCRYSYMIDNIILLITGTLHHRPISELIPKCHPLGSFEQMEAIHVASTPAELYNAVLVDTPLGIEYIIYYQLIFLIEGFVYCKLGKSVESIAGNSVQGKLPGQPNYEVVSFTSFRKDIIENNYFSLIPFLF